MERGGSRRLRGSFGRRDDRDRPRGGALRGGRAQRPVTGARKTLVLSRDKPKAIGGKKLKVRNIDDKQVSNDDLRVRPNNQLITNIIETL